MDAKLSHYDNNIDNQHPLPVNLISIRLKIDQVRITFTITPTLARHQTKEMLNDFAAEEGILVKAFRQKRLLGYTGVH